MLQAIESRRDMLEQMEKLSVDEAAPTERAEAAPADDQAPLEQSSACGKQFIFEQLKAMIKTSQRKSFSEEGLPTFMTKAACLRRMMAISQTLRTFVKTVRKGGGHFVGA